MFKGEFLTSEHAQLGNTTAIKAGFKITNPLLCTNISCLTLKPSMKLLRAIKCVLSGAKLNAPARTSAEKFVETKIRFQDMLH